MAYTKTTWQDGDVITAAKLNNEEAGIAANDAAVTALGEELTTLAGNVDGKADKVEEITIATDGAITQELEPMKWYHFTGEITALTITLATPAEGVQAYYRFDFASGATAPTLTVPDTVTMPNSFLVEPNGRYEIEITNGYAKATKWADNHSPFIYLDSDNGDFTLNTSAVVNNSGKVYGNVGTEVVSITIALKIKAALAANTRVKIADIPAKTKALIGATYATGVIGVGTSLVAVQVNTWNESTLYIHNNSTTQIAANTTLNGTIIILRTL